MCVCVCVCRLCVYLVGRLCIYLVGWIQPVIAHWAWAPQGWLFSGVIDENHNVTVRYMVGQLCFNIIWCLKCLETC